MTDDSDKRHAAWEKKLAELLPDVHRAIDTKDWPRFRQLTQEIEAEYLRDPNAGSEIGRETAFALTVARTKMSLLTVLMEQETPHNIGVAAVTDLMLMLTRDVIKEWDVKRREQYASDLIQQITAALGGPRPQ